MEVLHVLLGLGANLPVGSRSPLETLDGALARLADQPGISVAGRSRWYRSPAYPAGSGPDFVNGAAALKVAADDDPGRILHVLHAVEREMSRHRVRRWGPRTCDLDMLGWGARVLPDAARVRAAMAETDAAAMAAAPEGLILPHPRLHRRAFVLVPLAEVAPDWSHPILDLPVRALLAALPPAETDALTPLGDANQS